MIIYIFWYLFNPIKLYKKENAQINILCKFKYLLKCKLNANKEISFSWESTDTLNTVNGHWAPEAVAVVIKVKALFQSDYLFEYIP